MFSPLRFLGCLLMLLAPAGGAWAQELRSAAEVRALTREQAAEGRKVRLSGVIASGQRSLQGFVLNDGQFGVYVIPGTKGASFPTDTEWVDVPSLLPGGRMEVEGITGPGGFAPLVIAQRVVYLGTGPLPEPKVVSLADLRTGVFDCQRASLRGVVQRWHCNDETGQFWLQLAEQGGSFSVMLDDAADLDGTRWVDAEVRVQGTCFSFFNTRGEIVGARLKLTQKDDIEVTKPALADPFSAPEASLVSLRPFDHETPSLHRQRLSGVVTLVRRDAFVYVQTPSRGFKVNARDTTGITVGDRVDAAGFVAFANHYAMMDEALLRKAGAAELPAPMMVTSGEILRPKHNQGRDLIVEDYDGALVTLRGRLVRVEVLPERLPRLYLDCDGSLTFAEFGNRLTSGDLQRWQVESELEVTGICSVELDHEWPADVMPAPAGFSMLLRDQNDVRVVSAPSWWTRQRVLGLLAVVLALAAVIGAWAIALRRRVQVQTEIIRHKIERESVLGERERIARELHDTVEQELMGVNMLLEETQKHLPSNVDRAVETLALAHRMLRHCREESRSSIRDLRSVVLENLGLPDALDELLRPVAMMNAAHFTVQTEGQPARLSTSTETNLLRLCHEAVANAARHSGAANIMLKLCYEPDEFRVMIEDDGKGFDPLAPLPAGGHFGLLGMEERADKIGARLKIESTPGNGTHVRITLPLR